uniref:Uncharacterized protein n=1 Tax=Rhizophora mucronata TaxID=61149 RepID=A0A2P2R2V4_RHIMU
MTEAETSASRRRRRWLLWW